MDSNFVFVANGCRDIDLQFDKWYFYAFGFLKKQNCMIVKALGNITQKKKGV